MTTLKVVLRKLTRKSGKYPLAIRVTKDRKSSFIHLGQNVKESDWDKDGQRVKKSHPNSARLNNFILAKLKKANDTILASESDEKKSTAQALHKQIKGSNVKTTFFQLAQSYIENLEKEGKYSRTSAEKPRIKHFRTFLKGRDIAFEEITESLLKGFRAFLKTRRKVGERTIVNNLIVIRTLYNLAIRENIVDRKYYPFGKGRIRIKFPESVKIGLNEEEVKALEVLDMEEGSHAWHARNVWLISFYFAGMRVSDVVKLRWADFQNERLHYAMGKNMKAGSLKIPVKAQDILNLYSSIKDDQNDLIFPDLSKADFNNSKDVQAKVRTANKSVNDGLKEVAKLAGINKPLTMHIARHTFGNISGDRIPIQMLQRLYRHSDITTTIGYQANFIHKDADDALDAVVGF